MKSKDLWPSAIMAKEEESVMQAQEKIHSHHDLQAIKPLTL